MFASVARALAAGAEGPAFDELVAASTAANDGGSALADALWLLDVTSADAAETSLPVLIRNLVASGALPAALALERLDAPVLESAGVLSSAALFARKVVRANTALLYRQQRYNLLREEPEGYARVASFARAALLASGGRDGVRSDLAALVGCFDLDPVRVADVLLDAYFSLSDAPSAQGLASHVLARATLELLSALGLPPRTLDSVLGQRLACMAHLPNAETTATPNQPPNAGVPGHAKADDLARFGTIAAHAVAAGRATAGGVMAHVLKSPGLGAAADGLADAIARSEGALVDGHSSSLRPAREVFASLVRDAESHALPFFVSGLLASRSVGLALRALAPEEHARFTLHPAIASAACAALVDSPTPSDEAAALCVLLGPSGLSADVRAYTAVCASAPNAAVLVDHALKRLFPSLAAMDSPRSAADVLWAGLSRLPVTLRYGLYARTESFAAETSAESSVPAVSHDALSLACSKAAGDAARRALRRLTRDNAATVGAALASAAAAQPALTAAVVVARVLAYESMAAPIATLLPGFGPLVRDCMVRYGLAVYAGDVSAGDGGRTRADGAPSAWLSALATFLASLCVLDIDAALDAGGSGDAVHCAVPGGVPGMATESVHVVVQTVVQRLIVGRTPADSVVVRALISGATGVEVLRDPSDAHVDALAGGRALRRAVLSAASARSARMSHAERESEDLRFAARTALLFGALSAADLLAPLCVALLRVCAPALKAEGESVRMMRGETDETRATLRQLASALSGAPESVLEPLRSALPSARALVEDHGASPADAAVLWRAIGGDGAALLAAGAPCALAAVFWAHALPDVVFPAARYTSEVQRLRGDSAGTVLRGVALQTAPRISVLEDEMRTRDEHVRRVRVRLAQALVRACEGSTVAEVAGRLYACGLVPRLMASADDALYCASFVLLLADVLSARDGSTDAGDEDGAIPASVLQTLLGPLYVALPGVLLAATDDEAHALGRMLSATLSAAPADAPSSLHAAFAGALSPVTCATRAAIVSMTHALAAYPACDTDAAALEALIAPLRAPEAPEDLRVLAARYLTLLHRAHPTWTTLDAVVVRAEDNASVKLEDAPAGDIVSDELREMERRLRATSPAAPSAEPAAPRPKPAVPERPAGGASRPPGAPAFRPAAPARTPSADLREHEDRLRRSMSGATLGDRPAHADRRDPGDRMHQGNGDRMHQGNGERMHQGTGERMHERTRRPPVTRVPQRPTVGGPRPNVNGPRPNVNGPRPDDGSAGYSNANSAHYQNDRWERLSERRQQALRAHDSARSPYTGPVHDSGRATDGAPPPAFAEDRKVSRPSRPVEPPVFHGERPISRPSRPEGQIASHDDRPALRPSRPERHPASHDDRQVPRPTRSHHDRFEERQGEERPHGKRRADEYASGDPSFTEGVEAVRPPTKRAHAPSRRGT